MTLLINHSQLINTLQVLEKLKSQAPLLQMWRTQKYRTNHHLVHTQSTYEALNDQVCSPLQLESSQFRSVGKSSLKFMHIISRILYMVQWCLHCHIMTMHGSTSTVTSMHPVARIIMIAYLWNASPHFKMSSSFCVLLTLPLALRQPGKVFKITTISKGNCCTSCNATSPIIIKRTTWNSDEILATNLMI